MRTKQSSWSLAVCLSVGVVAAVCYLLLYQDSRGGQITASLSSHSFAPLAHGSVTHPSASQGFSFDPVLVYASYLGGPNQGGQQVNVVYVDSSGDLYLAGSTNSASFPVTTGVVQPTQGGNAGFLSKIDPTGQHLIFSTYVPGFPGTVSAMTVDAAGNIYVAGASKNVISGGAPLPIPSGSTPFRTSGPIGILKLNPTATAVLAATYLGGSGIDAVGGIAVDSSDNLYITGSTNSNDFPTQNALQASLGTSGNSDFVTVLNSSLSTADYSTYLGANSSARTGVGHSIAVDASKNAYVIGSASAGFPTSTSGAIQTTCAATCVFIAKLNPAGSQISYATYLGSNAIGGAVAVDSSQDIFASGFVVSGGFNEMNPVSTFPSCNANTSNPENFVSKINASGSLAFSTCPGSSPQTNALGTLALDSSGNVYTAGVGFPTLPLTNPIQSSPGNGEPYIIGINPSSSTVVFASYIGGAQSGEMDPINDIAIDSTGSLYAAGYDVPGFSPLNPAFPVFNALQPVQSAQTPCPLHASCRAAYDATFLKIAPTNAPAAAVAPAALAFPDQPLGTASSALPVTIFDLGSTALMVSNISVTGDFSIQESCTTVTAAGGSCPVQVTFTPTAAGNSTGTLTITDNSAGSPRTVALTGVGGQSAVTVSPTSLSFSQAINTTGTSQVTLSNSGTVALQISTVQVSGSTFTETNNCGVSVPTAGSCVINVSFSPKALGNSTGTLTITDSAAGSPQTIALTGTGVAAGVGLAYSSSSASSATLSAGSSASTTIQVGGAGVAGSVSLACSGLPQGASCAFKPSSPVQMSATSPTQVQLTISTTARSQLFAPIVLTTVLMLLAMCLSILFFKNIWSNTTPRLRCRFVPLFALTICACGGGNGSSPNGGGSTSTGTPSGSHVITITATSGSSSQTLLFNLTVQ
jgi:hypothetical protein